MSRGNIIPAWDRFEGLNVDDLSIFGKLPTAPTEYSTDLRIPKKKKETVFRKNKARCNDSVAIEQRGLTSFQQKPDALKDEIIEAQLEEFGRLIPQREKFIEYMERLAAGMDEDEYEDMDEEEIEEMEEEEAKWQKEWKECMKSIEADIDAGKFNFDFSAPGIRRQDSDSSDDSRSRTRRQNNANSGTVNRTQRMNSLFDATIGRNMIVPSNLRFTSNASSTIRIIKIDKKKQTSVGKIGDAGNKKTNQPTASGKSKKPSNTPRTGQFECQVQGCDRLYMRKDALLRHLRRDHANEINSKRGPFMCPVQNCSIVYKMRRATEKHIRENHRGQDELIDILVPMTNYRKDASKPTKKANIVTCTKPKNHPYRIKRFMCKHPGCGRKFTSKHSMEAHFEWFHENLKSSQKSADSSTVQSNSKKTGKSSGTKERKEVVVTPLNYSDRQCARLANQAISETRKLW